MGRNCISRHTGIEFLPEIAVRQNSRDIIVLQIEAMVLRIVTRTMMGPSTQLIKVYNQHGSSYPYHLNFQKYGYIPFDLPHFG